MIRVWTDAAEAGILDRHNLRGSTFVYQPGAASERAVSVTMNVRTSSYDTPLGLLPIFEMNLPEGALRERLRLAFAKATGTFDDFDLLSIVGRSQVGRIRYTEEKEQFKEDVPFQSWMKFLNGIAAEICCAISSTSLRYSPGSVACSRNSWCAMRRPSAH